MSRFVLGALVLGLVAAPFQSTALAAEPTATPGGTGTNRPAASSVPADPPPPSAQLPTTSAKLSSHLDSLVRAQATGGRLSPNEQSVRAGLAPSGPGSLSMDANNNPIVEVRVVATSQNVLDELKAHGADILNVSAQYRTVTLAIEPSRLVALSNLASVEYVGEVIRPLTSRDRAPSFNAVASAPAEIVANATCGSVTSEADTQLGAETARTQFGVDGTGVKVGVLSDSYARVTSPKSAAQDIASGDLPGSGNPCGRTTAVQVVKEDTLAGSTDEGRAMLQAVHDLAPGASLAFATANGGEIAFAAQITALQAAGATVITDDIGYFNEPFYQDGPIAVAANNARAAGAFLTTAAGNDHAPWNGYEALAFRPVACPAPIPAPGTCHSFNGAGDTSYGFTLANNRTANISFQWAEPRFGVTQNFDIFLVNTGTNAVVGQATNNNLASGVPFELISHTNSSGAAESLALFIRQTSGTGTPRLKIIFPNPGGISNVEYATPTAPGDTVGATIYGHVGAAGELAVSATPFNDGTNPESFTSHGPMTFLFGPVNGTTPASPISPVTRLPDITATDGGANTFFGNLIGGTFRFFGTSQAAPHAAGVAALMRQKVATATPEQIATALTSTATPMSGGPAVVGAGRVNAVGALNALAPTTPPPPTCTSSRITRSVNEVSPGRLQVALSTTSGTFSTISTTGLSNATLEVNGSPLASGSSATLSGSTATLFVQRVGAGGPFTARFTVVDG
jgi:hypothetical protein